MKVLVYLDFNLQVMMNLANIQGREKSLEMIVVEEAEKGAVDLEGMKELQEDFKEEGDAHNNCSLMTHSQRFEEV